MKNKSLILMAIFLFGCSENNTSVQTSSQKEGLYTRLEKAISNLTKSFTASGTIGYSDGVSSKDESYDVIIEFNETTYFYQEISQEHGEPLMQEYLYKGDNGFLCQKYLDESTNTIKNSEDIYQYDDVMVNPFTKLEVKGLQAIKGQDNYYKINDLTLANEAKNFLTSYEEMSIVEFALHFDGDNFDKMRIYTDKVEGDEEDATIEEMLFTLEISNYNETIPSEIKTYNHVDEHDNLSNALNIFKNADNYTINVEITYSNPDFNSGTYHYYVDNKNKMMMLDGDIPSLYRLNYFNDKLVYFGYKNVNGLPYAYKIDKETGEVLESYDYNKYHGISTLTDQDKIRRMEFLMPRFGSVAAECYYSEGNNIFSSYNSTNRNCILNLLPYDEYYALTNTEFSLYLNDDSTINYLSLKDSKTFNDGSTSSSTGRIIKVTYSNINSTTIVDSFVKA